MKINDGEKEVVDFNIDILGENHIFIKSYQSYADCIKKLNTNYSKRPSMLWNFNFGVCVFGIGFIISLIFPNKYLTPMWNVMTFSMFLIVSYVLNIAVNSYREKINNNILLLEFNLLNELKQNPQILKDILINNNLKKEDLTVLVKHISENNSYGLINNIYLLFKKLKEVKDKELVLKKESGFNTIMNSLDNFISENDNKRLKEKMIGVI